MISTLNQHIDFMNHVYHIDILTIMKAMNSDETEHLIFHDLSQQSTKINTN
jgi:acyl-CoA thioesterase FadM